MQESGQTRVVGHLIESLAVGGAENLAVQIVNQLAEAGWSSHLVVLSEPGPLSGRISSKVKTHYLGFRRSSISNPIKFTLSMFQGIRRLSGVIRRENIEVLQTHLPGSNFWGLLVQTLGITQVIPTIHNNREFDYGDADSRTRATLRKAAYRGLVSRCPLVVAVSEKVKDSLAADLGIDDRLKKKIEVVTNAIPIPPELGTSERMEVRETHGIARDDLLLLGAGRFCEQKNFEDLVACAEILLRREVPFRMIIAGEGDRREAIRTLVHDKGLGARVLLPGVVPDVVELMQASDIFCLSSLWEGLPLVLLESMASGLPTVAYGIPGISEVVQSGTTGVLVEPGDFESLASAMESLIADPDLRATLGKGARDRVRSRYSFDNLIGQLTAYYSSST